VRRSAEKAGSEDILQSFDIQMRILGDEYQKEILQVESIEEKRD
jgi:hypothetical protein